MENIGMAVPANQQFPVGYLRAAANSVTDNSYYPASALLPGLRFDSC